MAMDDLRQLKAENAQLKDDFCLYCKYLPNRDFGPNLHQGGSKGLRVRDARGANDAPSGHGG